MEMDKPTWLIVIDMLMELWIYDIEFLSQKWVLWTIFPAIGYSIFMILKWFILTCPIWVPISIVLSILKKDKKEDNQ
jgi:hypothetical protein